MPNWKKVITSGSDASLNKLVVDGSIGHVSASLFSGSFYGNGSNLTGIEGGIFAQTGSIYATTNELEVSGSLVISQSNNGQAIDIINTGSRWRQYIDSNGHITLNASGSGNNTNVNYTLEKGNFQVNLEEGHFNLDIDNTSKDFRIRDSSNNTYFVVTGNKKVGIGSNVGVNPNQDVEIEGTVRIRDYGSGNKTGTLAYTLGVDSNGDIIETTGGSDTNIANTDLTATADRTLDMQTNKLTISASQYFIDTFGGDFEVDARQGNFRVKSDTGHNVYIEGLPNTETPNIVGYNTSTGRLSYYSTGSFGSGGGSTVYTPDVYQINTVTSITATTKLTYSATSDNPTIIDGTTGTTRTSGQTNSITFNSTGIFEISYTVNLAHGDPATDNRMNPAIYAKAGEGGVPGTSEIDGSLNATYIRLPGANQAPNGSIHGTFYYDNVNADHILELWLTFLGTTSNPDIDVVKHNASIENTLTIRKIS